MRRSRCNCDHGSRDCNTSLGASVTQATARPPRGGVLIYISVHICILCTRTVLAACTGTVPRGRGGVRPSLRRYKCVLVRAPAARVRPCVRLCRLCGGSRSAPRWPATRGLGRTGAAQRNGAAMGAARATGPSAAMIRAALAADSRETQISTESTREHREHVDFQCSRTGLDNREVSYSEFKCPDQQVQMNL